MSGLARTDALYAFGLAVWSAWCAGRGTSRPRAHAGALVVLELGLVLTAVAGLFALSEVEERATFGGYLTAAVIILPAAAAGAPDRASRWDSAVLALACLALAVVAGRIVVLHG